MSLKNIKLLVLDVDGVLTDGRIIMDEQGRELMAFNIHDGSGIKYLIRNAMQVVLLSGRSAGAVRFRARALGIQDVYQGIKNKLSVWDEILKKYKVKPAQVCYVGDDLLDIPLMRRAGYPVAVRNARPEVKKCARYVTRVPGGHGAVREVIEKILKAQNKWSAVLKKYL